MKRNPQKIRFFPDYIYFPLIYICILFVEIFYSLKSTRKHIKLIP